MKSRIEDERACMIIDKKIVGYRIIEINSRRKLIMKQNGER